jgi:hypothetical protein
MKTEHILLSEDPHSTWMSGDPPKKNPGGAATPESGASVETRKGTRFARPGNQAEPVCKGELEPITIEVHEFSSDTQQYIKQWSTANA